MKISDIYLNRKLNSAREFDLKKRIQGVLVFLSEKPRFYLAFGPYWWIFKRLAKKFFTENDYWVLTETDNPALEKEYDHGDLKKNFLACMMYQEAHNQSLSHNHFLDADQTQRYMLDDDSIPI